MTMLDLKSAGKGHARYKLLMERPSDVLKRFPGLLLYPTRQADPFSTDDKKTTKLEFHLIETSVDKVFSRLFSTD